MPKSRTTGNGEDNSREDCAPAAFSGTTAGPKVPYTSEGRDHGAPGEAGKIPHSGELEDLLRGLFRQQKLAVLGTQGPSGLWGSLVAFASTDDLRALVFVTGRCTRKYGNLKANPRVSLVMDNRSNELKDFEEAIAVTAVGLASELSDDDRERLLPMYLEKHPHLSDFAKSPSSALFRVDVEKFSIVYRFQNVVELVPVT